MMKRNKIIKRGVVVFGIACLIIMMLLTLGCATDRVLIGTQKSKTKFISDDKISIGLKYLPKTELINSFGNRNNPFISPVSFLESNKLMVFKLSIVNKDYSELVMYLKKLEIQFGKVNANPYNRFQLANFWESRLKRQPEYEKWNMSVIKSVINKNVFDNKVVINKRESSEGLIVFKGPFPDYGEAVIYIPIFDKEGNIMTRYEIRFEF